MKIHVLLTPIEQTALRDQDLSRTVCVVFDILRATSTMVTALWFGAHSIVPVVEIEEAIRLGEENPDWCLAGERDGLKIGPTLTGGVWFDYGNSPREFIGDRIRGSTVVMTTTNGTRALKACDGAEAVYIAAFLNLTETVQAVLELKPASIMLVCAGTGVACALEDVLAAGTFVDLVLGSGNVELSDAAVVALQTKINNQNQIESMMKRASNGARLLRNPDLALDVSWCSSLDKYPLVAGVRNAQVEVLRRKNVG